MIIVSFNNRMFGDLFNKVRTPVLFGLGVGALTHPVKLKLRLEYSAVFSGMKNNLSAVCQIVCDKRLLLRNGVISQCVGK